MREESSIAEYIYRWLTTTCERMKGVNIPYSLNSVSNYMQSVRPGGDVGEDAGNKVGQKSLLLLVTDQHWFSEGSQLREALDKMVEQVLSLTQLAQQSEEKAEEAGVGEGWGVRPWGSQGDGHDVGDVEGDRRELAELEVPVEDLRGELEEAIEEGEVLSAEGGEVD